MSQLHISDIKINYQGHNRSQFVLFPLIAWFLVDVLKLPDYFGQITVNKKRNHNPTRKPKKRDFSDSDGCPGFAILGIERIGHSFALDSSTAFTVRVLTSTRQTTMNERLSTETGLAKLLGLPRFFDQSTAPEYLNRFSKWHVQQIDTINVLVQLNRL